MARQLGGVWDALKIVDTFIQPAARAPRAPEVHQKVFDNGFICWGDYEGWYCEAAGLKTGMEAAGRIAEPQNAGRAPQAPRYF